MKGRRPYPGIKSLNQPTFRPACVCRDRNAHVFPPEGYSALDTIDISYGVVTGRHLAVTRFAFDDVYPTAAYRVSFYAPVQRSTR